MRIAEPGLSFWLDFLHVEGGVWEAQSETCALAVLPPHLQGTFGLTEEILVSTDPEIAREDGGVLMIPGHPVLEGAAGQVLGNGDVGRSYLDWPAQSAPTLNWLVDRAREQFGIDHGRIDPGEGEPRRVYLPVLRVGVTVQYSISQQQFQERDELWVDTGQSLPLSDVVVKRLLACTLLDGPAPARSMMPADLEKPIAVAHQLFEERATDRGRVLARYAEAGRKEELARTTGYYKAILESIARRCAVAPPERARLLEAQAEVTRAENDRRLVEVAESYVPKVQIRPFRLHLVGVPALVVPVHIRRGNRTYPMALSWLLNAGTFSNVACPGCGSAGGLVAGREFLGCRGCLPPPSLIAAAQNRVEAGRRAPEAVRADIGKQAAGGSGSAPPRDARRSNLTPSPPPEKVRGSGSRSLSDRRVDRVIKEGNKLAMVFWMASVGDQRWRGKQTEPRSPLACLHRLYGSAGALWAVGAPVGTVPGYVKSVTAPPDAGDLESTTGSIQPYGGSGYTFTLRWTLRQGVATVGEVLPYPMVTGRRIPGNAGAYLPRAVDQRLHNPPEPRAELDAVEQALWNVAVPALGLPLFLRCLALRDWASTVRGLDFPEDALSAGLMYVTVNRAGRKMTHEQSGAPFGAGKDQVAAVARALQAMLRAEPRPW